MIRRLSIGVALAATVLVGAPAQASNGCHKVATGTPSEGGGGCTYTATGPGRYTVETSSGFRISWRRGLQTIEGPARVSTPNSPASGVWAGAGDLATLSGDIVTIAIGTGSFYEGNTGNTLRWQDGFIAAYDQLP